MALQSLNVLKERCLREVRNHRGTGEGEERNQGEEHRQIQHELRLSQDTLHRNTQKHTGMYKGIHTKISVTVIGRAARGEIKK